MSTILEEDPRYTSPWHFEDAIKQGSPSLQKISIISVQLPLPDFSKRETRP